MARLKQKDIELAVEREKRFLGSARVDISVLSFSQHSIHAFDAKRKDFLLFSFGKVGCSRLELQHHVPATINGVLLKKVAGSVERSASPLLSKNSADWPRLKFPTGFQLGCLHGLHRIAAAKEYLQDEDRWWTVDLYSEDLSNELRTALVYQCSNEKPLNAGEAFYHILRSRRRFDSGDSNLWWTRIQSNDQRHELRRLLKRSTFLPVLDNLIDIPALWPSMRMGMIGSLLRVKCDEEVIHYLKHIWTFWTTLLGKDESALQRIDSKTVLALESRNPVNSVSDKAFLKPLFQNGEVFGQFSASERDNLWVSLQGHTGLIPSFYTFFQDFKYLEALADCLKKLVRPAYRQTVFQAFSQSFFGQAHEESVHQEPVPSKNEKIELAYRRIVLFAMRYLEDLRPGSLLLEEGEPKIPAGINARIWYDFAKFAEELGFKSPQITDWLLKDPDRTAARISILHARDPVAFRYDEHELECYVDEIITVYAKVRKSEHQLDPPLMISTGPGEGLERRSGLPYRLAYEMSRKSLFFNYMNEADTRDSGEITPFFVRRYVYLSFFGKFEPRESPVGRISPPGSPSPQDVTKSTNGTLDHQVQYPLISSAINKGFRPQIFDGNAIIDTLLEEDQNVVNPPSPFSLSNYSQNHDSYTELSPYAGQVFRSEDYREPVLIKFVLYNGGSFKDLHEVIVVDIDDQEIEQIAARYTQQGLIPFNSNLRTLAPSQCLESALEDPAGAIILIPENEIDQSSMNLITQRVGTLKRVASDELLDQSRPRKFHVIGD